MMRRKSFPFRELLWVGLAGFAALLAVRLMMEARANREIAGEIRRLEDEARQVDARNAELRALIDQFSGERFAEEEARTKLGLKSPGERVVILTRPEAAATTTPKTDERPQGNARRWLEYFFK